MRHSRGGATLYVGLGPSYAESRPAVRAAMVSAVGRRPVLYVPSLNALMFAYDDVRDCARAAARVRRLRGSARPVAVYVLPDAGVK